MLQSSGLSNTLCLIGCLIGLSCMLAAQQSLPNRPFTVPLIQLLLAQQGLASTPPAPRSQPQQRNNIVPIPYRMLASNRRQQDRESPGIDGDWKTAQRDAAARGSPGTSPAGANPALLQWLCGARHATKSPQLAYTVSLIAACTSSTSLKS